MARKKIVRKNRLKGDGIVTDIGGVLFPVLTGAAGAAGGTALGTLAGGPVGSVAGGLTGEVLGSMAGTEFNNWLKTLGLGNGLQQGDGLKEEAIKLLYKGFQKANEIQDMGGIKNYLESLYNLWRKQQGGAYTPGLSMVGRGMPVPLTVSQNGSIQVIPMRISGMGSNASYGMISSEFGKIQA
jgi:hypothetical protein